MSKFKESLELALEMSASEMVQKLKSSVINRAFQKQFPDARRFQARVDFLATMAKISCMDREVTQLEREYTVQKAAKLLHDDDLEALGQQFDLMANLVRRNLKATDELPFHIANLLKTVEDHLPKFLEVIIGLIAADGESEKREEYILTTLAQVSGLSTREMDELILNCRYQVEVFLNNQSRIPKEQAKAPYELPTIKFDF